MADNKESIVQDKYKSAFPATIPGRKEPVKLTEFEANPRQFPTLRYVLKDPEAIYTRIDENQKGIEWVKNLEGKLVIQLSFNKPKPAKKSGRPAAPKKAANPAG